LAQASGIETPTRQDLAKLDRERKNKVSNKDWEHPHDPDARIKENCKRSGSNHDRAARIARPRILGIRRDAAADLRQPPTENNPREKQRPDGAR